MTEGQNKRQIGKGMKPRGSKRVKPQKETKKMTDQSTTEGQTVPSAEPVLKPQEGNETPGNLEPENGENSLQNLENSGPIVAHDDDVLEEPSEAGNELLEALSQSGEPQFTVKPIPGREFADLGGPTLEQMARSIYEDGRTQAPVDLETAMEVGTGTTQELQPPCGGVPMGSAAGGYAIGVDYGLGSDKGAMAVIKRGDGLAVPDELLATFGIASIGPQPDGSEKFIVTVQEGYTEAVRQWAEADGVPVERWLSDRLYEYISTYGAPAQGR
jgi:hypothetical protein